MQQNIQNEIISWAQSAAISLLVKKRNELNVLLRHALYGNEEELKSSIKIIDNEMCDRAYQQRLQA